MNRVISGYAPDAMFGYFEELSAIPRGSGNESGAADYLCRFAEEHGLEYKRDASNNVFIKRSPSEGREGEPAVLFTAHTDMVCEKNNSVSHDFASEGLKLKVKDGILTADGTTLGADDGAGVVLMMSLLAENFSHPALECLFTTDEETGMAGAKSFDYSQVTATTMINLDSEGEAKVVIGCAGGVRCSALHEAELLDVPKVCKCLKLTVGGLIGGHSGADIHLGRASAINITARLLSALYEYQPFGIVSMTGGNKDNAIARECITVISVSDPDKAKEIITSEADAIRRELGKADHGFYVRFAKAKSERMFSYASSSRLISAIQLFRTGIISRCANNTDIIECSSNIGVITTDGEKINLCFLLRSSSEGKLDSVIREYKAAAKYLGFTAEFHNRYPCWTPIFDSPLQHKYIREAKKVFGEDRPIRVEAIHAGLECGVMLAQAKTVSDAIAMGPEMWMIHTPDEYLDLLSCEKTFKLLIGMLA